MAAKLNYTYGLPLTRGLRVLFGNYWDKDNGRMRYGRLKQFSEDLQLGLYDRYNFDNGIKFDKEESRLPIQRLEIDVRNFMVRI